VTTLRTLAVHDIVQRTFPRPPPTEQDEVAMAVGRAIDGALSHFGHLARLGRKPGATAMRELAGSLLDDGLAEAAVEVPAAEREKILAQFRAVLQAFRQSEIFGLARPRTRVIRINGEVGVYAQPDYWDGRGRFFEMKSYAAIPPRPDTALQLRLFQLAFPNFEAVLVCLNRHTSPVTVTSALVEPPSPEQAATALRLAYDLGMEFGEPKVAEYVEGPFVDYTLRIAPG